MPDDDISSGMVAGGEDIGEMTGEYGDRTGVGTADLDIGSGLGDSTDVGTSLDLAC